MKTAILKINNINPVRNSVISNGINKKQIVWCLSFVLASFFFLYVYLITQTTLNIVAYQTIEQKIIEADSSIGKLEFEYLALKNKIDYEMAKTLGYADALDIKFVDRNIVNNKLSLVYYDE